MKIGRLMLIFVAIVVVVTISCCDRLSNNEKVKDSDTASDTDTDSDSDTDADSDSDCDSDTDTGSEIDTNCFDLCKDDDVGEGVDASMWTKINLEPIIYCHFDFGSYSKEFQEYICQEQEGLECFLPQGPQHNFGVSHRSSSLRASSAEMAV
jgi:hypothetical protein